MDKDVIIEAINLVKHFPLRKSLFQSLREQFWLRGVEPIDLKVHAVDKVSFKITAGETFGLVGESGCGKTTVGLLLLKLMEPTSGVINFKNEDISKLSTKEIKSKRKEMQMIFQNPYESLSPRFSVLDSVAEPLRLLKIFDTEEEVVERVRSTLQSVGLPQTEDFFDRYPHELSGGMRQRIGVARAYTLNPSFIVADEPVSMLDVSIRVGVLRIMKELVQKFQTAFLFITHDLALARYMCDRIGVMYLGRIVELGRTEDVVQNPIHPYTKALISAVPDPDPEARRTEEIPIVGEIPSGIFLPKGCRFHPRCVYAKPECQQTDPDLIKADETHFVACIRFREINEQT
ncbi:MAG: ABC transporter ATP-binding protein [Candidatus Hodarchaeales archaeon]|jgi:peptide/nickel transport system ATP-binding protein